MPLHDHFHAPLDDFTSWDGFHGQWPAMIVHALTPKLPHRYVATPRVHSGSLIEIDVAAFEQEELIPPPDGAGNGATGGVATAVWAPARPTFVVATDLPDLDNYEIRVYDAKRGRRLVATIEIVSPANKDRPEHRHAFVAKCAALLQERVSVTIIDLVTTRNFNLYGELLTLIGKDDPALESESKPLYAVACRGAEQGHGWQFESWLAPLTLGRPLPTLPLWLADDLAVPLELEASYEQTCRDLRII